MRITLNSIVLICIYSSCTDYEVFDAKNIPDQGEPVMSCFISPEADTTIVSLMYATSLFYRYQLGEYSSNLMYPIENANISLTDNLGNTINLQKHSKKFMYYSLNSVFPIREGKTYFLKAKFDNDSLFASTLVPMKVQIVGALATLDSFPVNASLNRLNIKLNGTLSNVSQKNISLALCNLAYRSSWSWIGFKTYSIFGYKNEDFNFTTVGSAMQFTINSSIFAGKGIKWKLGIAVYSCSNEVIAFVNKNDSLHKMNYSRFGDLSQSDIFQSIEYSNIIGGKGVFGAYRIDTMTITKNK